jgi:beta-1,4-N-acetylglucosaminyltransferase
LSQKLTRPSNRSLTDALDRIAERIIQGTLDNLPPYRPPPFPVPAADRVTFFDWMVLTCYPEELAVQMQMPQQPMVNGEGPAVAVDDQEDNSMLVLD